MRKLAAAVKRLSIFILDMDGVLYLGETPINGAAETIKWLRGRGKKVGFSTNNATLTRRMYVQKLARMGIHARESEIITSAYAAAVYLRNSAPNANVYVVGEIGLKRELSDAGLVVLREFDAQNATHVVVGLDRFFKYEKIAAALRALLSGAKLVATNTDCTYPTESGLLPGAGAMLGAIVSASGRKPDVVIGKPSLYLLKLVLKQLQAEPSEVAVVGDRLDTDIIGGKKLGLTTILVLSGVTKKEDVSRVRGTKIAPDFVIDNIADLMVS